MQKGRVYWITGLPGSGKTTIGTALYYDLREIQDNVIILDGDILKYFVGDDVGYSSMERLARAKKYSNICKILADQGMWVIICTVAMFDEIRKWNRDNIDGYIEIFLNVPFNVLRKRNKKGLYTEQDRQIIFTRTEFPKNPDLVIGSESPNSISESISMIKQISPQKLSDYDRDREYWNDVYERDLIIKDPSPFAQAVLSDMLIRGGDILELGCGNGRDSVFFAKNGLRVTAIDASDSIVSFLKTKKFLDNITFICDDFVKCKTVYRVMYDSIYSRFTLHAINEKQETEVFENVKFALKKGGRFYIEARSINDDLYGLGRKVGENAFIYEGHYRRFIDLSVLNEKLKYMGFHVVSSMEDRGFSITDTQDPVLVRVIVEVGGKGILA